MGLTRVSGDILQTSLNVGVVTATSLTVGTGVTISGGIVSATSFVGDGTNLTNTGSTLSAASGSQRVVLTGQTSGTMTASATSSSLAFNASTGTLSATKFSGDGSTLTGIAATDNVRTDSLVVSGVTTATGGVVGNLTGNVNATGLSTFSGGINVGNTFLRSTSIGIGTTTTTGRNTGIGTATGTTIYNSTENILETYTGTEWSTAPGKISIFTAYLSASQSYIGADSVSPEFTRTRTQFNAKTIDKLNEFNTSNYTFNPQNTGIYLLTGYLRWGGNNSMIDGGEIFGGFRKNVTLSGEQITDSTTLMETFSRTFSAGALLEKGVWLNWTWIGELTAGDSVLVSFYQRSGVTLSLTGGVSGCQFSGYRIA
jgi:hypothetical protein